MKSEQGKYSYTKRKRPVIDSKSNRQWAPEAEEALTVSQQHPRETLPSLPVGGWSTGTALSTVAREVFHPRLSLLWVWLFSHPSRAGAQSLENFTPFFGVIAENHEKALACLWHSFEGNFVFWSDVSMQRANTQTSCSVKP